MFWQAANSADVRMKLFILQHYMFAMTTHARAIPSQLAEVAGTYFSLMVYATVN